MPNVEYGMMNVVGLESAQSSSSSVSDQSENGANNTPKPQQDSATWTGSATALAAGGAISQRKVLEEGSEPGEDVEEELLRSGKVS